MANPRRGRGAYPENPFDTLLKQSGLATSNQADAHLVQRAYGDQAVTVQVPGKDDPFVAYANPPAGKRPGQQSVEDVAASMLGAAAQIKNPSPEQLGSMAQQLRQAGTAAGYGNDDELMAQLYAQQGVAKMGYGQRLNAQIKVLSEIKENPAFRQKVAELTGLADAPRPGEFGLDDALASVAEGLASGDAKVRQAAEQQVAAIKQHLGSVIKPEVNDWANQPVDALKDMPVLGALTNGQMAMAAAAGVGAGSVALANHLMAKGQQQSDPVAYAAAMQSMNAY